MPAAVPVAVMAAGAIASKVAKNKQASKQAKNNQTAIGKVNDVNQGFGDELRGYGQEDRSYQTGQRGKITDAYWDLYNGGEDDGSGGGGGGGFTPTIADARMNEAMPFYRDAMNTGLFSEQDKNDWRARTALSNDSTFAGLKRSLDQGAAIRGGGYAGYNSQLAALGRDKAREMEAARLNSEGTLQSQIRDNRFRGGEGVGKYDTEFMGNERMVEGMRNAAGAAAAGRASAGADDDFRRKMSILGAMRDLRGESGSDLPYFSMTGNQYGRLAANPETAGTPWYGTAGDIAQGAASAYVGGGGGGALSGIAGLLKKKPKGLSYGDSGAGKQFTIPTGSGIGYASSGDFSGAFPRR